MRFLVSLFVLLIACSAISVSAQEPRSLEQAPPPLKIIPRAERDQLETTRDDKARVKLTIELAEAHLAKVETNTSLQQYDAAAAEAGMYWALIDDAFKYLKSMDRDTNRRRDNYKRIELALRAHGPRWSSIRRGTPSEYAVWIKETEDFARNGRTEALNSFYGHTVLREMPPPQKPLDSKDKEPPKP